MTRIALLAGATGLVGAALLPKLLAEPAYAHIVVPTRRPLALQHAKLDAVVGPFDEPATLGDKLRVDDVFCCLGTTTRKAGGNAGLERVDYTLVLDLARAARAAGATRFYVVSAAGAGLNASTFYSQVKGRMERDVATLGYEAVHIVRPSLLLGARAESRPGESIAQALSPLLAPLCVGPLLKYRPIRIDDVASALHTLAQRGEPGVHIHHLPLGRA